MGKLSFDPNGNLHIDWDSIPKRLKPYCATFTDTQFACRIAAELGEPIVIEMLGKDPDGNPIIARPGDNPHVLYKNITYDGII
jgi:hypothetical protein